MTTDDQSSRFMIMYGQRTHYSRVV